MSLTVIIGHAAGSALDGDVVVPGSDGAVRNRDVFRAAPGINAVCVAGQALSCVDLEAPDGEAVAMVVYDVKVRGVLERDAVEGEVVSIIRDDETGNLLAPARAGLFGQVPPGEFGAEHFFAAAAVDDTVAHDTGVEDVIGANQGPAAVPGFGDRTACRRRLKAGWMADGLAVGRQHRVLIQTVVLVKRGVARSDLCQR